MPVPGRGRDCVDVGGVVDESVADDLARLLELGLFAVRVGGGLGSRRDRARCPRRPSRPSRRRPPVVRRVFAPLRLHPGPALGTLELARLGRLLSGWRVAVDVHGVIRRRGRIGGGLGYDGVGLEGARPRDLFCGIGHVRPGGPFGAPADASWLATFLSAAMRAAVAPPSSGARRSGPRPSCSSDEETVISPGSVRGGVMTSVVSSFKPRNSNWCFGHVSGRLVSKQCLLCPTMP